MEERTIDVRDEPSVRLLFVCLGNICRSPIAETVMAHRLAAAGLEGRVDVDSAGTGDWHIGDKAHARARAVAERRGTPITHRGRVVDPADLRRFDLLLAMDGQNLDDLRRGLCRTEAERSRIVLFGSFDAEAVASGLVDIPDPYGKGDREFEGVYDRCSAAADGLLAHLCAQLGHDVGAPA